MNIKALLFLCSFIIVGLWNAIEFESIQWMTWDKGEELMTESDLKYLVWIYDENCESCIEHESTLFTDYNIKYINEHFHSIRFEAHTKQTIHTKGTAYNNLGPDASNFHELAFALTSSGKEITFPQLVFLDENMDLIVPLKVDMDAEELRNLLSFVSGDYFFDMNIEEYEESVVVN